jgi:type IV secretory pathway TrbL component
MNKHQLFKGPIKTIMTIINAIILLLGLFMLGPGLYTAVSAIIED